MMEPRLSEQQNLAGLLWQYYQEAPDRPALTMLFSKANDVQLSFRELINGSAAYAKALAASGIQPGEVVILILQHSCDLVFAFWGTILYGAIPSIMPFLTEKLLPDHYRLGLEALFKITSPSGVITYADFVDEVVSAAQNAPTIRSILSAETVSPISSIDPEVLAGLDRASDDIVLLQHSSGTTGLQKGVALSHKSVLNQIKSYSDALQLNSSDVIVSWLPLYHDMGLIAGFILPILTQIHLVLLSSFDWVRAPYRLMQAVSNYRGTLCWLPNFAYNFCSQKIRPRDLEKVDLSSLRAVINCSEPMHWRSHQLFLETFKPYGLSSSALATCYAMAENVFAVTQGGIRTPVVIDTIDAASFTTQQVAIPVDVSANDDPGKYIVMLSAGRAIDGTQLRIVDSQGNDVPERCIGEIALYSDCMLSGYYHRPDLTEKAFINGWYLTGDLGYLADDELFVTGRKKDLIIVGGKNVYPQDLERLASEVDGVHPGRVVAFGVYNDSIGTEDVILIAEIDQYENMPETDRENISTLIRQRVTQGSDVALRFVKLVERNWLLKTSSGKIARTANRDKYLQENK